MPRALITGINGFTGQHLARELQAAGWDVVGLGQRPTCTLVQTYFSGDLQNAAWLSSVLYTAQPDAVVHLASLTPVSRPPTEAYYHVNVLGSMHLLDAVTTSVPEAKVLLITSSAMFGRPSASDSTLHEASDLLPVNAYGVSKAAQHLLGYQYIAQHKLRLVRVCPFNFIGPAMPQGLVAADFAAQFARIEASQQAPVISVGDLNAVRDFLDVRDAVRALRLLLESDVTGDHYLLSSGRGHTIQSLLEGLVALSPAAVTIQPNSAAAPNLIPIQIGDNALLRSALAWQPEFTFEQSLAAVLESCRQRLRKEST